MQYLGSQNVGQRSLLNHQNLSTIWPLLSVRGSSGILYEVLRVEIWPEEGCSVLSAQCSVLSAQCSVLSIKCSVLSAQCSMLSAQCSVLSAQCSVLSAAPCSRAKLLGAGGHSTTEDMYKTYLCAICCLVCPICYVKCVVYTVLCFVFFVHCAICCPHCCVKCAVYFMLGGLRFVV